MGNNTIAYPSLGFQTPGRTMAARLLAQSPWLAVGHAQASKPNGLIFLLQPPVPPV
jgi:hypothetical protein